MRVEWRPISAALAATLAPDVKRSDDALLCPLRRNPRCSAASHRLSQDPNGPMRTAHQQVLRGFAARMNQIPSAASPPAPLRCRSRTRAALTTCRSAIDWDFDVPRFLRSADAQRNGRDLFAPFLCACWSRFALLPRRSIWCGHLQYPFDVAARNNHLRALLQGWRCAAWRSRITGRGRRAVEGRERSTGFANLMNRRSRSPRIRPDSESGWCHYLQTGQSRGFWGRSGVALLERRRCRPRPRGIDLDIVWFAAAPRPTLT